MRWIINICVNEFIMKKIMFNDKYELTKAVLEGRKTITRRAVPEKLLECITEYAHGDEAELIYLSLIHI